MLPFTCTIRGAHSARGRGHSDVDEDVVVAVEHTTPDPDMRASRHQSRRSTSYHNSFQTTCTATHDDPPTYAQVTRQHQPVQPSGHPGRDVLPRYSSTVNAEAKVLVSVESINPLHGIVSSEWREVYLVIRGTLLSFHRVKDGGQGRLLRDYTLQHAEVGLAPDVQHTILVPQTRLAHFVPTAARRRAWQKDPDLFRPECQTLLRLRAETDQILLAHGSEELIHQLIYTLGAAIDISPAIDERSIPKPCTVPRRRRRVRHVAGDMTDPALLAQQERLFQAMYPGFAGEGTENGPELRRTASGESQADGPGSASRDEDELLDLAMMRGDEGNATSTPTNTESSLPSPLTAHPTTQRPQNARQTTGYSINSTVSDDMIHATAPENFTSEGKWQPPNTRTLAQAQRYIKRCMPVLLAEAVRASDVLICNGRRVCINRQTEMLEEWELQPPSYTSHGFGNALGGSGPTLQRPDSRGSASASGSEAGSSPPSPTFAPDHDDADAIAPVEHALAHLKLSKTASATSTSTTTSARPAPCRDSPTRSGLKSGRHPHPDIHSVVFCF